MAEELLLNYLVPPLYIGSRDIDIGFNSINSFKEASKILY